MSSVTEFACLFRGRIDAFGTEEGGAWRPGVMEPPWLDYVADHLNGKKPIGVYPMVPFFQAMHDSPGPWLVKWGCVDLDVKGDSHRTGYNTRAEAYEAACNLRQALNLWDVTAFVEVTRSGGYHVWVFAKDWVSAAVMRRALIVACDVANVPPAEVNPKSEWFDDPETLGNYVRLPYPGALSPDYSYGLYKRVVLDADGVALTLAQFLADAMESLTPTPLIEQMASLYKPEPQVSVEFGDAEGWDKVKHKLSGLAYVIATEDLLEGQDRSSRLWKLAKMCKDDGLTPAEAVVVVTQADILHGQKFVGRRDGERRIQNTVRRAYQEGDQ